MRKPRIAVYSRVSTNDQTTENQAIEIDQLAQSRGEIVARFSEVGSAAKTRPAFESMLKAARRGAFDMIVVWALDRFGRSMTGNLNDLLELDRIGISVISVKEPWLDTSGPTRSLLAAIFSWISEQERLRICERTKAGMARAARQGTRSGRRIGRPRRRFDVDAARAMLGDGRSQRDVARSLGVGLGTLQRAISKSG